MLKKTMLSVLVAGVLVSGSVLAADEKKKSVKIQPAPEKVVDVASEVTNILASLDAITTKVLNDAKADRKKAASVGGEWRDIGKLIKKAEQAKAANKYVRVIELSQIISSHSNIGYAQAMAQTKFKAPSYLKY